MLVSAVTGDVGAGKSTLTACWRRMGASVIDADEIVRSLWRRPDTVAGAVSLWGGEVVDEDGAIIHSRVAVRAFSDASEYRRLCDLLHPLVRVEMERAASSLEGWVVAEIPLLFEGGLPWWVDLSVYVSTPLERRVELNRVRGWDKGEITRREGFLLPSDEKRRLSTYVVENSGTLDELTAQAEALGGFFKRASGLARCSVVFERKEDLAKYCERLKRDGLGVEPLLCGTSAGMEENLFILSFFTLEDMFSLLPSRGAARGPYLERVRRMPWGQRLALLEGLGS